MCVCDRINFEFLGDHSGCFVGNGSVGPGVQAAGTVREL